MTEELTILSRNLHHITANRNLSLVVISRKTHLPIRKLEAIWQGNIVPDAVAMEQISKALGVRVTELIEEEPAWMGNSFFNGRVH